MCKAVQYSLWGRVEVVKGVVLVKDYRGPLFVSGNGLCMASSGLQYHSYSGYYPSLFRGSRIFCREKKFFCTYVSTTAVTCKFDSAFMYPLGNHTRVSPEIAREWVDGEASGSVGLPQSIYEPASCLVLFHVQMMPIRGWTTPPVVKGLNGSCERVREAAPHCLNTSGSVVPSADTTSYERFIMMKHSPSHQECCVSYVVWLPRESYVFQRQP